MEFTFLPEEDLRMGGRDQEARMDGATCHITQLQVFRFEPEPLLYEVKHTAFVEFELGKTLLVGYSTALFADLIDARVEFLRVHEDPPVEIGDIP